MGFMRNLGYVSNSKKPPKGRLFERLVTESGWARVTATLSLHTA